jgi:hypothetical protein
MNRLPMHSAIHSQYPDNLSEEDQQTYRRWVRGLYAVYAIAIAVSVVVIYASRPAGDLEASNESAKQMSVANPQSGSGTRLAAEKK